MTKASDLFIQCLEEEGVEYNFGVPDDENLDFLDSLSRSKKIRQGAGFMAVTSRFAQLAEIARRCRNGQAADCAAIARSARSALREDQSALR